MGGFFFGILWEIFGKYLGNLWEFFGNPLGNLWNFLGILLDYLGILWELTPKFGIMVVHKVVSIDTEHRSISRDILLCSLPMISQDEL